MCKISRGGSAFPWRSRPPRVDQRVEVTASLGGERPIEALGQLILGEPAAGKVLTQLGRRGLALGVTDPHLESGNHCVLRTYDGDCGSKIYRVLRRGKPHAHLALLGDRAWSLHPARPHARHGIATVAAADPAPPPPLCQIILMKAPRSK